MFFEGKIALLSKSTPRFLTDDEELQRSHQVLDSDLGYYMQKFLVQ